MPVDYAALVMSQDLSEHDFLTFVAGGSGMLPKSSARAVWPPRRRRYKADQNFRYVIGLKGFVWNSNPEKDLKVGVSYFQLQRDQGTLPAFGSMSTSIVEARTHMHLDLSISQPYSCSAIMVLADVDIDGAMEQPSGFETSTDPFILLHMFINYACKTAATYAKQWNGIVDELDKELSIDVNNSLLLFQYIN